MKKPQVRKTCGIHKAEDGTRTHDPFITSEVLYQLSYISIYICRTTTTNVL